MPAPLSPISEEEGTDVESLHPGDGDGGEAEEAPQVGKGGSAASELVGREERELSFRLAYVDFDGKQALEQYETFPDKSEFIRKCCPAIFEGMKILRNFFHTP